jgi:ornithine carbamoyltransferase
MTAGTEVPRLSGQEIALIFEETSTQTRSAFQVASYDQGAHVTYLDPAGSQASSSTRPRTACTPSRHPRGHPRITAGGSGDDD